MSRRGRAALGSAVAAVLVAAGVGLAVPAAAHSQLVSSSPADGAVVAVAPTEVAFTFDEDLLPGVDTIAVSDDEGNVVSSVKVEPDGNVVRAPWPADLPDGTYQAAYRIVSADGHPVSGAILVTIDRAASSSPAPSGSAASAAGPSTAASAPAAAPSATSTSASPGGTPIALVGAVTLLALVLAGGLLWAGRRRRDGGGGA